MSIMYIYIGVLSFSLLSVVFAANPGMLEAVEAVLPSFTHVLPPEPVSSSSFSSNTVSWQSAFLGLIPLALNAMTQPSRLDMSFSQSSLLFPSRSSPFICFADALEVIISLCIQMHRGKSVRQAARLVNWERARCRLGHETEELEDIAVEKHPIPFVVLFIGTVLQAIKIFGFQGMIWIKVWASAYVSSFVVLAMVGFVAPRDWRENPPEACVTERSTIWTFDKISRGLCYIALGAQFFCSGWIYNVILGLEVLKVRSSTGELGPSVLAVMATEFAPLSVVSLLVGAISSIAVAIPAALLWTLGKYLVGSRSLPRLLRYCLIVTMAVVFGTAWIFVIVRAITFTFNHMSTLKNNELQDPDQTVFALAWKLIRGCANILMYVCFMVQIKRAVDSELEQIPCAKKLRPFLKRKGLLVIFGCWNFFEAFLYYRFRFDPEGTVKPAWTDKLG